VKRVALLLLVACGHSAGHERKHDASIAVAPPPPDAEVLPVLPPAPPLPALPVGLPPLPADLPAITPDEVALGELLFYDPRLSHHGKLACVSCHDPHHDYTAPAYPPPLTDGAVENARAPMPLTNLAYWKAFGWDGKYATIADALRAHVVGQLGDELPVALRERILLRPIYRAHFARVGGDSSDAAIRALSAFVLTRYAGSSEWDSIEAETTVEKGKLATLPSVVGYQLFMGRAGCAHCHPPPLYTDFGYHAVHGNPHGDPGHARVDPSAQAGAMATTSLRGAADHVIRFHAGETRDLATVCSWYAYVGSQSGARQGMDPLLDNVKLSPAQCAPIVAFLNALVGAPVDPTPPQLP
jgi:cytochrome c peroxidase